MNNKIKKINLIKKNKLNKKMNKKIIKKMI